MSSSGLIVVLFLLGQVPPPATGTGAARELEAARQRIVANAGSQLKALAERLATEGDQTAAVRTRERLPRPVDPDGPTRFVPLPEVVLARSEKNDGEPWRDNLREIKSRSAQELFKLAQKAAKTDPPEYAFASLCLRAVIECEPDHREARRLLGYVPHQGGWARPFAVRQIKEGLVSHPTFGWVRADWVPHLDGGELPAPAARGQKKTRWLSAAEADGMRANWSPPWYINTEHFEIQTNVSMAEAISFGRRLEAFHDLFMALLADILGENLPLVRRFKDPQLTGDGPITPKLHQVYYFGTKQEFVDYLSPREGADIKDSLGFYHPPKSGRGRVPAYFYRDPGGQIPVTSTLCHEVSHQLLFETAGPNAYTKNVGNYWVFEGLGTYFETVLPQPDGSLEVGGLAGPRIEAALRSLVDQGLSIPLAEFIELDETAFMRLPDVYTNYQQAMALTVFLMQSRQGTYRNAFLDYVRDAYRGRIKRGAGRALQDRLGEQYSTLDSQFSAFLKTGANRIRGSQAAVAQPIPNGAIRSVPKQ
jgi:hypothetical protein